MRSSEVMVEQVGGLPAGLDELVTASLAEGFGAVERLQDAWLDGSNRFDAPGEALFEARVDRLLVGVCGLNRDPYVEQVRVGRVRHLYVHPRARRSGVATALVTAVVDEARAEFDVLRLRTDHVDADKFYRVVGFKVSSDGDSTCTHRLPLC